MRANPLIDRFGLFTSILCFRLAQVNPYTVFVAVQASLHTVCVCGLRASLRTVSAASTFSDFSCFLNIRYLATY